MNANTEQQTVTIEDLGRMDLVQHDTSCERSAEAERAILELYPIQRGVTFATRPRGETGVPVAVYNGTVLEAAIKPCTEGTQLVEWLRGERGQELLRAVCDGHTATWDGSNHVGSLDDDALTAWEELCRWLANDAPELDGEWAGVRDAADWLESSDLTGPYAITADTTDARLEEIAEALRWVYLEGDGILVGAVEWLKDCREELRRSQR